MMVMTEIRVHAISRESDAQETQGPDSCLHPSLILRALL